MLRLAAMLPARVVRFARTRRVDATAPTCRHARPDPTFDHLVQGARCSSSFTASHKVWASAAEAVKDIPSNATV